MRLALILAVLISAAAQAAEPDPRLMEIERQRVLIAKDKLIAQLIFESVALKEEKLRQEEEKIKAEKPAEKK